MQSGNRKASSPNLPSDIPEAGDNETSNLKDTDSVTRSSSDWEMDDIHSEDGLEDDEETGLTQQERSKRKRRKRRNTLMEERISQDNKDIAKEEQRLANASFYRDSLINAILIAMWYTFSISISVVSGFHVIIASNMSNQVFHSTTNGCFQKEISIFIFHSSPPACTWLCNSFSPPLSFTLSQDFDRSTHPQSTCRYLNLVMGRHRKHQGNLL